MKFITVTELKQKATQIVSEIVSTQQCFTVTKNGKPVVLMKPTTGVDFYASIPSQYGYVTEEPKTKKKGGEK